METKKKILSLVDMDIGLFISYRLSPEALTTRLFHFITLNTIPLNKVMELRQAREEDVTRLNRINWFSAGARRRSTCPVYTLQVRENTPRIFMKLDQGSYIELNQTLGGRHAG